MAKVLYRSTNDKMISGVCGGLADYSNLDSSLIRILVVVVGLFTAVFPVLIGYFICALIIPEKPNNIEEEDVEIYDKDGNKIYKSTQKKN